MKKFLILLSIGIFYGMVVSAQMVEAIHLKNGSVVKGVIVEFIPKESVKIQTADGSLFVYSLADVVKFTREGGIPQYNANNMVNNYMQERSQGMLPDHSLKKAVRYPRYQGEMNAGYVLGLSGNPDRVVLEIVNGCRIMPYLYAGVGVAPSVYYNALVYVPSGRYGYLEETVALTLPVYLDVKGYYPVTEAFSVYTSVDLGYSIGIKEISTNDVYWGWGIGFNLGKWNVGFSYQSDMKAKGFGFKTGFLF